MAKIFVSIASYRDPELLPTLRDLISKAKYPENLKICIAWQHSLEDTWDNLDEFKDDPRFNIVDIDHMSSQGTCWARHLVHEQYSKETYYLQLDSHHRFEENWDDTCIKMIKQLQKKGYKKPLLTAYIPSYNPQKDPEERSKEPWWMTFDRFIPEGAVFFMPAGIPDWQKLKEPIRARFLSAHFIFTLGSWCEEVPYDPMYYFHGEEISLAARSYTSGYDLFHPHKIIAYHEYTRIGRTKQWDDDKKWEERNKNSHARNRKLFGIDGECSCGARFGKYGFGKERSLADYEAYSGLRFSTRSVQQYTLDNKLPPNPIITDPIEYEKSFAKIFKHCIDIYRESFKENDYDFWCVAFENRDGVTIHRKDADENEVKSIMNTQDQFYKVWRTFEHADTPTKWVVWPHSKSKGWVERVEGNLG